MSERIHAIVRTPAGASILIGVLIGAGAGLIGFSLATLGPIYTVGFAAGGAAGLWMLTDLNAALYGMIGVICVLPFGTLPFKIAITPSLLDIAMAAVLLVYIFQWMTGRRWDFVTTPLHPLMLAFIVIVVFSFVAGLRHAWFTSNLVRQFAELILSLSFVFLIVDIVRNTADLRRLARTIIIAGFMAAIIGIVLYAMPDALAERSLVRLARIGYPDGGVIRYVEDDPDLNERAIGTSVDPNVLGGTLMIVAALTAPQIFARERLLGPRWVALLILAVMVACLLLTFSRSSMMALAAALTFIALIRYRKLLLILLLAGILILFLPATQDYITHFGAGLQGEDLATQMRIGEYTDAFRAIGRHPIIGVGFAGTPEIDIYLGVASVYLSMLQNMGILGTGVFLLLMAGVFVYAARNMEQVRSVDGLEAVWLGLHASIVGTLVNGITDHYFFRLEFHHASTLFWLFVALALAATRIGHTQQQST